MLEAMIKRKGEAPPGALARLNSCRVGGRLNTALEGVPTGTVCASLSFAKKAMCSKASQPMARKMGVECCGTNREGGGVWGPFPGYVCLELCIPP